MQTENFDFLIFTVSNHYPVKKVDWCLEGMEFRKERLKIFQWKIFRFVSVNVLLRKLYFEKE